MRLEGFCASFSPSFDPVAYCPLADPQSSGDIFLLPTFLFQFPRSFPSFFSPIGFLWCSHASYCLILYFFLSRSVVFDPLITLTPQEVAESALWLLLAEDLEGVTGALFSKIRKLKQVTPDARARNPQVGRRLWELSERLVAKGLALAPEDAR